MGVVQVYTDDDVGTAVRSRQYRQTIGTALATAYKGVHWHVDVNVAGGIATISCPSISTRYGMVVHLTRDTMALESAAKAMGGELLERFGISRERPQFGYLKRRIDGEALGAARGEA